MTVLDDDFFTENPKISIITGLYNSSAYLERLISSISKQTFTQWEHILVDDGSTDDTIAKLKKLTKHDPRFKWTKKKPEGSPARSRNAGLHLARGELIAFCDHDDFWAPHKLSIQYSCYQSHPDASIIHTDRIVWRSYGTPKISLEESSAASWSIQSAKDVLLEGQKIIFSSFMTSKSHLESVGGLHPDLKGVDDFYLFLRLSTLGKIVKIHQALTYYFEHDQNLSQTPRIFIDGLYLVAKIAKKEGQLPDHYIKAIEAQALKSDAVSILESNPKKARELLRKSWSLYRLRRTLMLMTLQYSLAIFPPSLRRFIVGCLKQLKARFPTPSDLLSKG